MAEDQRPSSESIELIIQGKRYKSIRDYKREQIKDMLNRSLSSFNLSEFSEDELYEIMREVRKQQTGKSPLIKDVELSDLLSDQEVLQDKQIVTQDAQDTNASQMQDMLDQYRSKHKGTGHLYIDPGKVKSIIIKPEEHSEDIPKD